MPTKEGPLVTFPLAMSQADQPIPNTFLSLPEAVVYARQAGFKDQGFGTSLRVMDSGMLGWTFLSFGNPMLSKALVIDATSGAATTYQEASGIGAQQRFAKEMGKPKALSGAAATNYTAMRHEADAMAAQWYSDMQLTHVRLVGTSLGSSLTIKTADFDYVGFPAKDKPWTVSVNVRNGQISSSGGQGVHPVKGPGKPVPSHIIDAEKALGTLLSRAGFLGGAVGLELFWVGPDGDKTSNFGHSIFGSIFPGTIQSGARPGLAGKSIWRLLVVNKQKQVIDPNDPAVRRGGSPGGVFDRSTANWVYLDAVSGKPL